MDDGIGIIVSKYCEDCGLVGASQIEIYKFCFRGNIFPAPGIKIVDDQYVVAGRKQLRNQVAADKSRTSGYHDFWYAIHDRI
jgi:hypothetical protein